MIFNNPYWATRTKLDLLAKWLIVHGIIYYDLGTSLVDDKAWDSNAKQYVWLARSNPDKVQSSRWGYVMHDFDGSTGFHLYNRLKRKDKTQLLNLAKQLVIKYGDASVVLDPRKRRR